MKTDLSTLTASDLIKALAEGQVLAIDLVEACLARIEAEEPQIGAWAYLDPDYARAQAKAIDAHRKAGKAIGPLHGLPVGIKDIIDTKDMPTENGTPLQSGRQPLEDATLVSRLREAGAVILGKTVTTELAFLSPGKTRNPHAPERTPGGSSSGSAAAVAAHMVPFAVGSQTGGSVIRPAAFCGVFGFKPTHGLISRRGVLSQSPHLDTMGVFGRSLADVALLGDALIGHDAGDKATRPLPAPRLSETLAGDPPIEPIFGFLPPANWDQADADTKEAFGELVEFLGEDCDSLEVPLPLEKALEIHRTIMTADFARSFATLYSESPDQLSDEIKDAIEEGRKVLAHDYTLALDWIELLNGGLDQIFERYDAIITPATLGEAPLGLDSTGSPMFCSTWTLCGTPAVTLPLLQGANGLPLGVQLIGRRGEDARLLRTARRLVERVNAAAEAEDASMTAS